MSWDKQNCLRSIGLIVLSIYAAGIIDLEAENKDDGDLWQVVIGQKATLVEQTAGQEVVTFIKSELGNKAEVISEDRRQANRKAIIIGTPESSKMIAELYQNGFLNKIDPKERRDDAFQIKVKDGSVYIAGQTPRSVLYGGYHLEEYLKRNANKLPAEGWELYKKPVFRDREIIAYCGFGRTFDEEDIKYLSRVGYNLVMVNYQGGGGPWWGKDEISTSVLCGFAESDIFPKLISTDIIQDNIAQTKRVIKLLNKYGIEGSFFFFEPFNIIRQKKNFVEKTGVKKDIAGFRKTKYYTPEGIETTCINSPKVQEWYRDLMKNFIHNFPEVKKILIYSDDSDSWFCHPKDCPRCAEACKDADHPSPWENYITLINILQKAANEVRPDFSVSILELQSKGHTQDIIDRLEKGSSITCSPLGVDWNISTFWLPENAKKRAISLTSRCKQRGMAFISYDCYTFSETFMPIPGLAHPWITYEKFKNCMELGMDGICDMAPTPISQGINPIICKEFWWNSNISGENLLRQVARDQFGEASGEEMYKSWLEMMEGFKIYWADGGRFWIQKGVGFPTLLRPLLKTKMDSTLANNMGNENNDAVAALVARSPEQLDSLWEQFREIDQRMQDAIAHGKKAVKCAYKEQHPFYAYYYEPRKNINCREYAEEQYHYIRIAAGAFISVYNYLQAAKIVRENEDMSPIMEEEIKNAEEVMESLKYLSKKLGLLGEYGNRKPRYEVLGDKNPTIQELQWKLDVMKKTLGWVKETVGNELTSGLNKAEGKCHPIDLKPFCNISFKDDGQGDGQGGWDDSGPHDMRNIPLGRLASSQGIPFDIVDPGKNDGKSCILLHRADKRGGANDKIENIHLDRYVSKLHLLLASTYTSDGTYPLLKVKIEYEDKNSEIFSINNTENIRDWTCLKECEKGSIAWKGKSGTGVDCCLFGVSWKNPRVEKKIKTMSIETLGTNFVFILAITVEEPCFP